MWKGLLLSFGAIALLAGGEFYAVYKARRMPAPVPVAPAPIVATPVATPAPTITPPVAAFRPQLPGEPPPTTVGAVDTPTADNIVATSATISGWAAAAGGIKAVEVQVDGVAQPARYGLPRADVAAARPDIPNAANSGFTLDVDFSRLTLQRHELTVVAIDQAGSVTTLARRSVVPPGAMALWLPVLDAHPRLVDRRFTFLMATSAAAVGGAAGIETQYAGLLSHTMRVGMSVPILYMRTTKGAAGDWAFDPDFDLTRKCKRGQVAEDNLSSVIAHSIKQKLPVNFILNGGIWGDAGCYSADWDLTTHLELDDDNVQWDQRNVSEPGDFQKGLAGSTESPELSRSLTYHIHNATIRNYKRRNLQAAARIIAQFAREHPDLFVGINLDADTYMNPFIPGGRRHDYNPGMLLQFREWLAGTGAYAGRGGAGAPDLRYYRRAQPLTLAEVNRLAGRQWTSWSQVDPPREFIGGENAPVEPGKVPFWEDPWYLTWDAFRKHVVQLHYAELAQWTHEAGVPADRIFTAQAFTAPDPELRSQSTYVIDRSPDYDGAGVSIEGAVPRVGHLGTIVYGIAAENGYILDSGRNLFATIARFDPQWAIVETNATDLKKPTTLPPYARSYREFRDFFNYGGRQIALMAWNGSNGLFAGSPGYLPYTSWRNTQGEQAMMDFLVSHADVPTGSLLWTFGSAAHADTDGWTTTRGTVTATTNGLAIDPLADRLTLRSPVDQVIRPALIDKLLVRIEGPQQPHHVALSARTGRSDRWRIVAQGSTLPLTIDWPAEWLRGDTIVEEIEVELLFPPGARGAHLTRLLLYPRG